MSKVIKWEKLKKDALWKIFKEIDAANHSVSTMRAIVNAQISKLKATGKPIARGGFKRVQEALKDDAETFLSLFDVRKAGAVIKFVFGDNSSFLSAEYDDAGNWVIFYTKGNA